MRLLLLLLCASLYAQEVVEDGEADKIGEKEEVAGNEQEQDGKTEESEDGIVRHESIDELGKMINESEYLLAYFFHPNSNPSMEYADEFDQLPDELEQLEWAKDVELVKVNMAGNEEGIREKYGVRGYPITMLYKRGRGIRYNGRRKNFKVIEFLRRRINFAFQEVTNAADFRALLGEFDEDTHVTSLVFYDEGDSRFSTIENVTDDYDHVRFLRTNNPEVAAELDIKAHGLYLVKAGLEGRLMSCATSMSEGDLTYEEITFFLDTFGKPLVRQYTAEETMVIFDNSTELQVFLLTPDAETDKDKQKILNIKREFIKLSALAVKESKDDQTMFMMADSDNPDNFRLMTFFDVLDDEPPTYRIASTATHNRFGRQAMTKKEWKAARMFQVVESARLNEEKFQLSEGPPEDFFDQEILFLTTSTLEQNIQVGKPMFLLFHNGKNTEEMEIMEKLTDDFPHATYKKKKRGYPRLAKYNIKRNIILANEWSQVLRGLSPKAGDFFMIRNIDKMIKYKGSRKLDAMKKWIKEKSEKKLQEHDEL